MKRKEKATQLFTESYNCSQSTLGVFAEDLGLSFQQATAIAAGFGAGICYQGKTCGAVTGAYMVLGLFSGRQFTEHEMVKENTYQLICEFNKKFEGLHGTTECKQLLNVDISTPEGIDKARNMGLFSTKCPLFVADAVEFIEKTVEKNSL
jgi:C_GCAxxG_C_C family probable redox protein